MKITPLAYNHIQLKLDDGSILDVNDGSSAGNGLVVIRQEPFVRGLKVLPGLNIMDSIRIEVIRK